MDKQTIRIEDWSVQYQRGMIDRTKTPEERLEDKLLHGRIMQHPRLTVPPEGVIVVTSGIKEVNGNFVTTHNTIYELGVPDSDWIVSMIENTEGFDSQRPVETT